MARTLLISGVVLVICIGGGAWAGYDDGSHAISIQGDWGVLGQIMDTSEDGTAPTASYLFRRTTDLAMSGEIDGLSSGHHPQTTISQMFSGNVTLLYSVEGAISQADATDSDIYWVQTTGPVDTGARLIHDTAADLGLTDNPAQGRYYDLDAIESHAHTGTWPNFPDHGAYPEYFSVGPFGALDPGAIYVGQSWDAGTKRYRTSSPVMSRANLGLADGDDVQDFIFFDESFDHPTYGASSLWAFFTVGAGQNGDAVGDNVYVSRGDGNNYLWFDPQDDRNWDGLDVVPEPGTMALMGFGLAALALGRRRRKQ